MPILSAKSFQSIRFEFSVQNTTSKMTITKSKEISLIEIASDSITLSLPPRSCANGHNLNVKIEFFQNNQKQVFETTALVEDVKASPQASDLVRLKLLQFDSAVWTKILKEIQGEGDQVFQLFQNMKGVK